jgi:glucose 1-dehydrogenase
MQRPLTLVTGGTRGIGAGIALRLATGGHDVVLGYRRDDESAVAVRDGIRRLGASCVLVRADLTTDSGIAELFDAAEDAGTLTGVVNNAGSTLHVGPLIDTSPETVRAVIEINLTSAVLVARRAVQALSTQRGGLGGVLVNVSSAAATTGSPGEYVHYAAAKAGVDALTTGLAHEALPHGVRVVGVAPGTTDTRIHADAGDPGRIERVAAAHPMGRPATPDEIAASVAFLLSDDASYIAGTTLRVAGGR